MSDETNALAAAAAAATTTATPPVRNKPGPKPKVAAAQGGAVPAPTPAAKPSTLLDTKYRDATPDADTDPAGYRAYVAHLMAIRKPFGALNQKLARPNRPGYYRVWINDEPGRVHLAMQAGYNNVKNPATGENETFIVDPRHPNGPMLGYLMEIPIQLWELDHKATHKRTDDIEAAIRKSKVITKDAGEAKEDEGGFYVPKGGSKVESGLGRSRT